MSEHRTGRRSGPVGPWVEQLKWGLGGPENRWLTLKVRALAQIRGSELQGNKEPALGLPWVRPGSSSVAQEFLETLLGPAGPSVQAAGEQGMSQDPLPEATGPLWG